MSKMVSDMNSTMSSIIFAKRDSEHDFEHDFNTDVKRSSTNVVIMISTCIITYCFIALKTEGVGLTKASVLH